MSEPKLSPEALAAFQALISGPTLPIRTMSSRSRSCRPVLGRLGRVRQARLGEGWRWTGVARAGQEGEG